jgi:hypothetical protein
VTPEGHDTAVCILFLHQAKNVYSLAEGLFEISRKGNHKINEERQIKKPAFEGRLMGSFLTEKFRGAGFYSG